MDVSIYLYLAITSRFDIPMVMPCFPDNVQVDDWDSNFCFQEEGAASKNVPDWAWSLSDNLNRGCYGYANTTPNLRHPICLEQLLRRCSSIRDEK